MYDVSLPYKKTTGKKLSSTFFFSPKKLCISASPSNIKLLVDVSCFKEIQKSHLKELKRNMRETEKKLADIGQFRLSVKLTRQSTDTTFEKYFLLKCELQVMETNFKSFFNKINFFKDGKLMRLVQSCKMSYILHRGNLSHQILPYEKCVNCNKFNT